MINVIAAKHSSNTMATMNEFFLFNRHDMTKGKMLNSDLQFLNQEILNALVIFLVTKISVAFFVSK